jgi:hypothetical protein
MLNSYYAGSVGARENIGLRGLGSTRTQYRRRIPLKISRNEYEFYA